MNKKILYTLLVLALITAVYFLFFNKSKVKKFAQAVDSRYCNKLGALLPEMKELMTTENLNRLSDNELVTLTIGLNVKAGTREENISSIQRFLSRANSVYEECKKA